VAAYIADLDFGQNPMTERSRLKAMAAESHLDIRQFIGQPTPDAVAGFIIHAAGLWLRQTGLLRDEILVGFLREALVSYNCVVEIGINELEQYNGFLARYGLEGTRMGLVTAKPREGNHPRLIRVNASTHPGAFRHPVIFEGVDAVLIQHPQVLLCRGEATPILTVPLSEVEVTDLRTDFFQKLEVTAVGVAGVGGNGGRVLAVTGGLFDDAYTDPTGFLFPGIRENPRLARNVLRWLCGETPAVSLEEATKAFRIIDRIERSIAGYMKSVLERVYPDWWTDGIPLKVRASASTRAEEERNQLPRHCYLDLVQWKEVADANWEHIEADWRRVGWGSNKTAGLKWFDELNDIRKVVMHPTKRAFGAGLSSEQLSFLRTLNAAVVLDLAHGAQPRYDW
jgi:hypothetical protein